MNVVGTIDETFLGIWPGVDAFWTWFESEYFALELQASGQDNDASFIGNHRTYPTHWRRYRDINQTDIIVRVYIVK